ncbi:hypothetical protein E4T47_03253 [Aureobasidium subglaciale]|nr:hypothetical protein E4T47_03253 [Aureobasidium subglaciale]
MVVVAAANIDAGQRHSTCRAFASGVAFSSLQVLFVYKAGCGRFQLGDGVSRCTPQVRVGWRTAIFTATENAASSFLWWNGVSGMAHAQGSRRGTGRSTGFQLTRI